MANGTIKIIGFEASTGINKIPVYRNFLMSFIPILNKEKEVHLETIKDHFILDIYTKQGDKLVSYLPKGCPIVPELCSEKELVFNIPSLEAKEERGRAGSSSQHGTSKVPDVLFLEIWYSEKKAFDSEAYDKNDPTGKASFVSIHQEIVEAGRRSESDATTVENIGKGIVEALNKEKQTDVAILRTQQRKSDLIPLFRNIKASTQRLSFTHYESVIDSVFFGSSSKDFPGETTRINQLKGRRTLPFNSSDGYRILKVATEAFLMANIGIPLDSDFYNDEAAIAEDISRTNLNFSGKDNRAFSKIWADYNRISPDVINKKDGNLGLASLPYLYIIRQKFKELNIKENWFDDLLERIPNSDPEKATQECFGIIRERLTSPLFIELIWSYWHEEGMLVQTMNAISRRFQNIRGKGKRDPLAEMEITHLRPLNNILWGYIQDEQHRLSIMRRAYEYDHHYGFTIKGKAIRNLSSADSRTRFLEAFHHLLRITNKMYSDATNRLVDPDAFPILNALREIHFTIAEGMHNQYGDLPSTARVEMLMQQWILARPELREFLPGRAAVPYPAAWMDRVASMCKLQGWTDTSPIHFSNLAEFGEDLLLSIRLGDWSNPSRTALDAEQWALLFRNAIQGYIHSYKAATGVDLTVALVGNKVDSQAPSVHLAKRLRAQQHSNGSLNGQARGIPKVNKEIW
ncbi:MAG: hypothetical protein R2828_10060 [Saprospiraceae bacterium]